MQQQIEIVQAEIDQAKQELSIAQNLSEIKTALAKLDDLQSIMDKLKPGKKK